MGCWKDWLPRVGVVYDLFGNHKTALKAGIGKYDSQYSTGFTSNFNPMALQSEVLTSWNTAGLGAACSPGQLPKSRPWPESRVFCHRRFCSAGHT